jgi:hypothetical protein
MFILEHLNIEFMKPTFVISIIFSSLLMSCNLSSCGDKVQNGKEQGIDCGGDCIDCKEFIGWANHPNYKRIVGTWHLDYKGSINTSKNQDTVAYELIRIELDSIAGNMQLTNEFLSEYSSEEFSIGSYKRYGMLWNSSYPNFSSFSANSTDVFIDNMVMTSVSDSFLILKSDLNVVNVLSRKKVDHHSETTYTWELEILNTLTESSKLEVTTKLYNSETGNTSVIGNPVELSNSTKKYVGSVTVVPGEFTGSHNVITIYFHQRTNQNFIQDSEIIYQLVLKDAKGRRIITSGVLQKDLKNNNFDQGMYVDYYK